MLAAEGTDADYATRISHLRNGSTGGLNNGAVLLTDGAGRTVIDDLSVDVLTGSEGLDWFIFNADGDGSARDKITDLKVGEYFSDLDIQYILGP